MGNFSKDPLQVLNENLAKNYVGLHLQQGVPLLDRDINLMQDLLLATVRRLAAEFFGNGIFGSAGNTGFKIVGTGQPNDFMIQPGSAMADGIVVRLAPNEISYTSQNNDVLSAATNAQPNPRQDAVYLDVWLDEETGATNNDLRNTDDIGIETSVRVIPAFVVRVREGETDPPDPKPGHVHIPLALLRRPTGNNTIAANQVTDARRILVRLSDLALRVQVLEDVNAPVITGIDPPIQSVNSSITITGENFNQGTVTVVFVPHNPAIAEKAVTLPAAAVQPTKLTVTVPDFPGTNFSLPCRIRIQTAAGKVLSNDATTPFRVTDTVP